MEYSERLGISQAQSLVRVWMTLGPTSQSTEDRGMGEEKVKAEGMPKRYERHAPRGTQ